MPRFWLIYNFTLLLFVFAKASSAVTHTIDYILPLALFPLLYLLSQDLKKTNRRLPKNVAQSEYAETIPVKQPARRIRAGKAEEGIALPGVDDTNRRLFLKLVGSTGLSIFFLAVFGKKSAQAAFFGSVPGPGTVAVKNTAGVAIDPAEAQPTDGYTITQIDDGSTPSYYGFVHKTGAWYITKEDATGAYRYAKGATAFSTSWSGRAGLTYDYFDNVF